MAALCLHAVILLLCCSPCLFACLPAWGIRQPTYSHLFWPEVTLSEYFHVAVCHYDVALCRPLMSVPHILADESSAYYHAYVLAEMSVHQTRAHFKRKYGALVDNDKVSADCITAELQHIICSA
jgi:hypothetical protein